MRKIIALLALLPFSGQAMVSSASRVHYLFEYRVEVPALPPGTKQFRLWIPHPAHDQHQKVIASSIDSPLPWRIEEEQTQGNRMIFVEGEGRLAPLTIRARYTIERQRAKADGHRSRFDPQLSLLPNALIPLAPQIQNIADEETKGLSRPQEKIRALYEYVYHTMTYDKSGTGWGRGDALWACSRKRGNCTDFHSLLIGLLRSAGIPAQFEIGVPIPHDQEEGKIAGYHCWAWAFDTDQGWFPIDVSEAKKSGMINASYGHLPPDRILFSRGRDLVLSPSPSHSSLNYFVYPYVEIDGKPFDGVITTWWFSRRPEKDI